MPAERCAVPWGTGVSSAGAQTQSTPAFPPGPMKSGGQMRPVLLLAGHRQRHAGRGEELLTVEALRFLGRSLIGIGAGGIDLLRCVFVGANSERDRGILGLGGCGIGRAGGYGRRSGLAGRPGNAARLDAGVGRRLGIGGLGLGLRLALSLLRIRLRFLAGDLLFRAATIAARRALLLALAVFPCLVAATAAVGHGAHGAEANANADADSDAAHTR